MFSCFCQLGPSCLRGVGKRPVGNDKYKEESIGGVVWRNGTGSPPVPSKSAGEDCTYVCCGCPRHPAPSDLLSHSSEEPIFPRTRAFWGRILVLCRAIHYLYKASTGDQTDRLLRMPRPYRTISPPVLVRNPRPFQPLHATDNRFRCRPALAVARTRSTNPAGLVPTPRPPHASRRDL
jgi:hypothetical protein